MLRVSELSSIVNLNPDFKVRLSLRDYLDEAKSRQLAVDFFPFSGSLVILAEILQASLTESRDRNHLIFGNSGLGKTYLGIILAGLLEGRISGQPSAKPVADWGEKSPDFAAQLSEFSRAEKFSLVIAVEELGKEDDLQVQLLPALNGVFYRRGIDYVPPVRGSLPR